VLKMKGMSLNYIFIILVFFAVLIVTTGIIFHFKNVGNDISPPPVDVKYKCAQLNNTKIRFDQFQDVLYGFLTDQCNDFCAEIGGLTFQNIENAAKKIDNSINVVKINYCELPRINSHTLYVNFTTAENISMSRRDIKEGDIIICDISS